MRENLPPGFRCEWYFSIRALLARRFTPYLQYFRQLTYNSPSETIGDDVMNSESRLEDTKEEIAAIPVATALDLVWGELAALPARVGAGPELAAELDVAARFAMGRLIVALNGAAAGREALDVR